MDGCWSPFAAGVDVPADAGGAGGFVGGVGEDFGGGNGVDVWCEKFEQGGGEPAGVDLVVALDVDDAGEPG